MGQFPNPDTQFKPGQSGNPKGRPPGTIPLHHWIQKLSVDEGFEVYLQHPTKGYVPYKGAPVKAVVETAWRKAAAGDDRAREWLAKYGWGTKVEVSGQLDGNITVNIVKYDARPDTAPSVQAT